MCGLVGIAGKLEYKDEATIKRMLVYDYFRGPDSTGFAALRTSGEIKIAKLASHPFDLFDTKKFNEALNGFQSAVMMGHNRLATKGVVNAVNAHPYEYEHIIGTHNGTLDVSSWRELEEALGEKTDVDSQAIFACFAKIGVEETVKMLRGAWALVWIDRQQGTLNFLKNKERPLWYSYTDDFEKVFWASEWPFIDTAVKLSTQPYKLYTEENTGFKFWSVENDWWYRFDLEELRKGAKKRPKPRVKEVKGKEPTPAVSYACGTDPFSWKNRTPNSTTNSHGHGHGSTERENKSKENKVVELMGSHASPYADKVSKTRFTEIAKYGCSWCQTDVEYGQVGVTVFDAQDCILCPTCSESETSSRIYVV